MKFTEKFMKNQVKYLDKYVHHTMFSFVNLSIFLLVKNRFLAYGICLGVAFLWELVQRIAGGKNSPLEMFKDAFASQLSALMFLGLLSNLENS